jgi:hypothetical protein
MLEIVGSAPVDFFGIHEVNLIGDGASASININLTQAPFGLSFSGNNPHTLRNFVASPSASGVTASAVLSGAHLIVTLSSPLPSNELLLITEALWSYT